jgi:hypothetical protein
VDVVHRQVQVVCRDGALSALVHPTINNIPASIPS